MNSLRLPGGSASDNRHARDEENVHLETLWPEPGTSILASDKPSQHSV
jgi:hypothetical protein